jgi:hypothetical protein
MTGMILFDNEGNVPVVTNGKYRYDDRRAEAIAARINPTALINCPV